MNILKFGAIALVATASSSTLRRGRGEMRVERDDTFVKVGA